MCASCQHSVGAHCDGIGRCNALVTDTNLSLAECNCPGFTGGAPAAAVPQ